MITEKLLGKFLPVTSLEDSSFVAKRRINTVVVAENVASIIVNGSLIFTYLQADEILNSQILLKHLPLMEDI